MYMYNYISRVDGCVFCVRCPLPNKHSKAVCSHSDYRGVDTDV